MTTLTDSLLAEVLSAHGGFDRWNRFERVTARVITGGFLWGMKGIPIDDTPRTMTSEFRRQWSRTEPFGNPDWHMTFQPHRVVIETEGGDVIAAQDSPRESFAGHGWETPWTPLQLGYFNGYAMWTYYNLPFLLGDPGFQLSGVSSITEDGLRLRGVRVRFPDRIHTHSSEQTLYFDERGLLRRHDYQVDVAGKARAAHLVSDYVDVQGLQFPTRRRVFMQKEDGTVDRDRMPVSVDLSQFELS